jgi:carbon-monoxide dehydrogenase iron sulfur subunit
MKRVYVNEDVCIGCHLCEIYCQLKHTGTNDLIKAFNQESPKPLARLRVEENGILSLSSRCRHCDDAPCVRACLTGALTRDPETRVVTVDEEHCIGCGTCMLTCPLGALKLDTEHKTMIKCDLCQDEEIPVCVANCPNEALVYVETTNDNNKVKETDAGNNRLRSR